MSRVLKTAIITSLASCAHAAGHCEDSTVWHKRYDANKTCSWVENHPPRCRVKGAIDSFKGKVMASYACPAACDTPCNDKADWHKKNDKSKTCAWVSSYNEKRCAVRGADGTLASESCPDACELDVLAVSTDFPSGSADVLFTGASSVEIALVKEPPTKNEGDVQFEQWFAFAATAPASGPVTFKIMNAETSSWASAWPGYEACAWPSPEGEPPTNDALWSRVTSTEYSEETGILSWTYDMVEGETVYFAEFDTYQPVESPVYEMCEDMDGCEVSVLGMSVEGRDVTLLTFGSGELVAWVIGRQHPGESGAEPYVDGMLERLFGDDDLDLMDKFTWYVVPNMNPDGSILGHQRTNAKGANLNREWWNTTMPDGSLYVAPSMEYSPEVYAVLNAMMGTGCDFFYDVHMDEELPYNFIAGSEGSPRFAPLHLDARTEALHGAFVAEYARKDPTFQARFGYPLYGIGGGDERIANFAITEIFDCLSLTMELPFKDLDVGTFHTPQAKTSGALMLDALAYVADQLRGVDLPVFGPDDAYIEPTDDTCAIRADLEAKGNPRPEFRFSDIEC